MKLAIKPKYFSFLSFIPIYIYKYKLESKNKKKFTYDNIINEYVIL